MAEIKLKRNQSQERMDQCYREGYYDYLGSVEFHNSFLWQIAEIISEIGDSVFDVGCGEAWLCDCLGSVDPVVQYKGIECSEVAVQKAIVRGCLPQEVSCQRFEEYSTHDVHDVVVFGGILHVLVEPESHIDLIEKYIELCDPSHVIIYDLARFDTTHLKDRWFMDRALSFEDTADVQGLQEVKKKRKVEVYNV